MDLLLDLGHIPGLQIYMLSYAGRSRIVSTLEWLENAASLDLFDAVIFTQERQDTAQKSGILKYCREGEAYQARSKKYILFFCGGKDSLMRLAVVEQCCFNKPFIFIDDNLQNLIACQATVGECARWYPDLTPALYCGYMRKHKPSRKEVSTNPFYLVEGAADIITLVQRALAVYARFHKPNLNEPAS
jgi:hypothetical protein